MLSLPIRSRLKMIQKAILNCMKGDFSQGKMKDYIKAHDYSCNHMEQLKKDRICGCFYCLHVFSPQEINFWLISDDESNTADTYGTAICPYCGIDSVIGESSGFPITKEFLQQMKEYWF